MTKVITNYLLCLRWCLHRFLVNVEARSWTSRPICKDSWIKYYVTTAGQRPSLGVLCIA